MITATGSQHRRASMYMVTDGSGSSSESSEARGQAKQAPTIRRVAVVEDELMVAWSIETMLEDLGYEVIGLYPSGEKALLALVDEDIDLLCMDINLGSGIDGIETARRIRAIRPAAIIFISAYSDAATKARALEAVPEALFLGKPVTASGLARAISDIGPAAN